MQQAEDLCKEALEIDPDCDVAIATLAQLSLQQGKISEAIDWFEKSAKLARTEVELTTAITCRSGIDSFGKVPQLTMLPPISRRTRLARTIGFPAGESGTHLVRCRFQAHSSRNTQNYPQMAERLGQLASQLS